MGKALSLTPQELAPYLGGSAPQADAPSLSQLSIDAFNAVADWYNFAILELATLKHFKADAPWVARVLGITVSEANLAVERLVRLGLLEIKGSRWKPTRAGNTTLGTEQTSAALRRVQKQFLEKALAALEEIPVDQRDQAGVTVNVALKDLPELKNRIRKLRKELMEFAERNQDGDEVYQFMTSFFPLSKTRSNSR
jgi:uncharacterized protein (TIGR02147 family)